MPHDTLNDRVRLPPPQRDGTMSLEAALAARRSVREFQSEPMPLEALSRLLWACQGAAPDGRRRTAPSAGGTYPLAIHVAAGNVTDLPAGLYTLVVLTTNALGEPYAWETVSYPVEVF